MDNAQARFLLHAARPDGRDDADPIFAEALEQARRDPALGRWLEEERRLDTLFSAKLAGIEPPADLKAALLTTPKVIRFSDPRRAVLRTWLAVAAAVALLLAVPVGWTLSRPAFLGYEGDLYGQIASGQVEKLRIQDPHLGVLQAWLVAQGAPVPANLPASVLQAPSLGCRTFAWHGTTVAQVCFLMKDGQVAHLFVIGREGWRGAPPEDSPRFRSHDGWAMASWRDGGKTYVLAKAGAEGELQKLFL